MSELRIPIARRQHDMIAGLIHQQSAVNAKLETACNVVMAGMENEPATAQLVGVSAENGVYELVLSVPDKLVP